MRNLFFILIAFLVFAVSVFAQETSPCPEIEVTGPSGTTNIGDPMIFVVNIFNNLEKYKFDWSVSDGSIIEGQGTRIIRVTTSGMNSEEIKATVKVKGLPKDCNDEASEVGKIIFGGDPMPTAEYEKIPFLEEKIRLNKLAEELKEYKYPGLLVFIFYRTQKDSLNALNIRQAKIRKYLIETLKISKDSFVFVFGGNNFYLTRVYLVPKTSIQNLQK